MTTQDLARAALDDRPMGQEADLFKINAVDHVEFGVGTAKQSVFYWKYWGFKPASYSGLETGNRRYASWVVEQNKIRFVLSTPYSPHDEMAAHHMLHGDGVKVIAMEVEDVEQAWRGTTARGAKGLQPPTEFRDDFGRLQTARVAAYG